jgi:hypothetical protein
MRYGYEALPSIKGKTKAKGIWEQDVEANIWAQEGSKWGVEKAPQWGNSVWIFHQNIQGDKV